MANADARGTGESAIDSDGAAEDQELCIDARDLTLTYDDGTEAVQGVSLAIPCGEFFGFLGPNGAGKTTTIKMLATLLRPTTGSVEVNGYDVTSQKRSVRGTIGYMAQEVSVDEELTAYENLEFACEAYGVPRDRRAARIDELLDLVALADVRETPAEQFSGGMKKRLDAATALVHGPSLVFLDEPTTGLDPKARTRLWEYFERINDDGTTIFLTTQYLEEADALCDRLAVIRDGKIVEEGSPDALKGRVGGQVLEIDVDGGPDAVESAAEIARTSGLLEGDATVQTTDAGIRVRTRRAGERGADLVVAIRNADHSVTGLNIEDTTLEDVFLAIADDDVSALDRTEPPSEADG